MNLVILKKQRVADGKKKAMQNMKERGKHYAEVSNFEQMEGRCKEVESKLATS